MSKSVSAKNKLLGEATQVYYLPHKTHFSIFMRFFHTSLEVHLVISVSLGTMLLSIGYIINNKLLPQMAHLLLRQQIQSWKNCFFCATS